MAPPPPVCHLSSEPAFDAGPDSSPACANVPVRIFQEDCSGGICHHTGATPAANLDLVAPCVADRLVGVTSTCDHEPLVDPTDPDGGFFLQKLSTLKPKCGGASMPYGNLLPQNELACVRHWVSAVVHEANPGARPADAKAPPPKDAARDAKTPPPKDAARDAKTPPPKDAARDGNADATSGAARR